MSIYLIALNEPTRDDWAPLREKWPDRYYPVTDNIAFVAPPGLSLTEEIAETLGINDKEGVSGFVIEWQDPRTGYNKKALWEWMRKIRAREQNE